MLNSAFQSLANANTDIGKPADQPSNSPLPTPPAMEPLPAAGTDQAAQLAQQSAPTGLSLIDNPGSYSLDSGLKSNPGFSFEDALDNVPDHMFWLAGQGATKPLQSQILDHFFNSGTDPSTTLQNLPTRDELNNPPPINIPAPQPMDTSYTQGLMDQQQALMNNVPQVPQYTAPTLNPVQAVLTGLSTILQPRFAASNVEGALKGNTDFHNYQYEKQIQQQQMEDQLRQQHIQGLSQLITQSTGLDKAKADLAATQSYHAIQQAILEQKNQEMHQDRLHHYDDVDLQKLEQQFNAPTTGIDQMRSIQQRMQQLNPNYPVLDEAGIQRAYTQKVHGEWDNVQKLIDSHAKVLGTVSQADADTTNQQIAQHEKDMGLPANTFPRAMTMQTEQAKRDAQAASQWGQTFDLKKDQFARNIFQQNRAYDAQKQRVNYLEDYRNKMLEVHQGMLGVAQDRDLIAKQSLEVKKLNSMVPQINKDIDKQILNVNGQIAKLTPQLPYMKTDTDRAAFNQQLSALQGKLKFLQGAKVAPQQLPSDPYGVMFGGQPTNMSPQGGAGKPQTVAHSVDGVAWSRG